MRARDREITQTMSAFGGKADMAFCTAKCPLMTQSGHSKCYYYYRAGRNLRLSLASSISSTQMKSRPLLRFAICVVITSGINGGGKCVRD